MILFTVLLAFIAGALFFQPGWRWYTTFGYLLFMVCLVMAMVLEGS